MPRKHYIKRIKKRIDKFLHRIKVKKRFPYQIAGIKFWCSVEALDSFDYFKYSDPRSVEEMQGFIKYTGNSSALLDIGALHGIFSLVFCAKDGKSKAITVDPSPVASAILERNIGYNNELGIHHVQKAFGSVSKTVKMHFNWQHLEMNAENVEVEEDSIDIEQLTIDNFITQYTYQPDVIKIDVEGFELSVLQGGINYISTRFPLLFIEVHCDDLLKYNHSSLEVFEMLKNLEYQFFNPNGTSLSFNEYSLKEGIFNIICSKNILLT